jgi:c-di-GMP-binding flagellar brake protein YcgR
MDIARLLKGELNGNARLGLKCKILKFINNHKISDRVRENVFLIQYAPPMRKINLRSTYRLHTSCRFSVDGNIHVDDAIFVSGKSFSIRDISVTGIGLLVPKKIGKKENTLLDVSVGQTYDLELQLKEANVDEKRFKISTSIEIARKVMSFNDRSGFIGGRFTKIESEEAEKLYQYIHNAQLFEIRDKKRM